MSSFFFLSFWCDLKINCVFLNLNLKKLEENSFSNTSKSKKNLGGGHPLTKPSPGTLNACGGCFVANGQSIQVFYFWGTPFRPPPYQNTLAPPLLQLQVKVRQLLIHFLFFICLFTPDHNVVICNFFNITVTVAIQSSSLVGR